MTTFAIKEIVLHSMNVSHESSARTIIQPEHPPGILGMNPFYQINRWDEDKAKW